MTTSKKVQGVFAAIFAMVGILLLDRGITGNVVLGGGSSLSPFSVLGLVLVACGAFLAVFALKR